MKNNKKTMQYISINKLNFNNFICNDLNSPESFGDYEINVIDFSNKDLWKNVDADKTKLNADKDIENISQMLLNVRSKILIVLPQNFYYRYYWGTLGRDKKGYKKSEELKNMSPFINKFIERLISQDFKYKWVTYNKTNTKINDKNISSDFVFKNAFPNQIITSSEKSKMPTTINYANKYITTLNLKEDETLTIDLIKHLGWLSEEESAPEWFSDEKYFDDVEIYVEKEKTTDKIKRLSIQLEESNKKIKENNFYKSVLYKTGDDLVEVVNIILDEMLGYDYSSFNDDKKEDFLIEKEDITYIGEIKGIGSNVRKSDISQTANHRDLYKEIEGNENKNVIALSIITRQRTVSPLERHEVNLDVIKIAKMNDVLIITTEILLRMLEELRAGKITSDDIINILKSTKGIVLEKDIKSKKGK